MENNNMLSVALQCAPMLTGLKMSNLLIIKNRLNKEEIREIELAGANIFMLYSDEKAKVYYLYNERLLERQLKGKNVKAFLESYGYSGDTVEKLELIKERYGLFRKGKAVFPHEMGVFLGYPLDDVIEFIKKEGKNSLYTGYWKVYTKPESKQRLFKCFDFSKNCAVNCILNGEKLCSIKQGFKLAYANQNL